MRYKRTIACICLFTFLFMPFAQRVNYKNSEVEAAFVIDDAVYLMILASVVGTGFYIANHEQGRKVVGDLIYENFTSYAEMEKELFEIREDIEGKTLNFKDLAGWTKEMLPSLAKYNGIIQDTAITMHNVGVGQDISTSEMGEGCTKTVNYDTPQNISFYCRYANGTVDTSRVYEKITRWWLEPVWNAAHGGEYQIRLYFARGDNVLGFLYGNPVSMNCHYGIASIESNAVSQLEDKRVNTYDFTASKDSAITNINDWALSPSTNISIPKDYTIGDAIIDYPSLGVQQGTITGVPGISVGIQDTTTGGGTVVLPGTIEGVATDVGIISGTLEGIADTLTGVMEGIIALPVTIVSAIADTLKNLFVPTINFADCIIMPDNGWSNISDIFDFENLLCLEQKPYRFETEIKFYDGTTKEVKIYFDEISILNDNIDLVRKMTSYSLLIMTIMCVVWHFMPKRVED